MIEPCLFKDATDFVNGYRLLAFSNGDLQALYDRSNGFYRRQLILTTKEKPADRVDDPDIAEKMKLEIEGIFLWAFEGLQRLTANMVIWFVIAVALLRKKKMNPILVMVLSLIHISCH